MKMPPYPVDRRDLHQSGGRVRKVRPGRADARSLSRCFLCPRMARSTRQVFWGWSLLTGSRPLTLPGSKWEFGVGHLASDAFEVGLGPMIRSQAHWGGGISFLLSDVVPEMLGRPGAIFAMKGINKAVGYDRRHKTLPPPYSTYQRVKRTQYLVLRDGSAGWDVENPDGSEYTVDFRQSPRSDHRRPI